MSFTVTCTPGPAATVACRQVRAPQWPALVLYLDRGSVEIRIPPFPHGDRVLARFCRDLAREAAKFAAAIDPDGGRGPTR